MRGPATDERDQPAIDRLETHARQLFFELLRTERSPVAMVGSGLSIIYGGVSWTKSVELCRDYTLERLKKAIKNSARAPGIIVDRLKRFQNAIRAFEEQDGLKSPSDKYVALDLFSDALGLIDSLPASQRGKCELTDERGTTSSFRAFMAKVYKDDSLFVRMTLASRFCIDAAAVDAAPGAERRKARKIKADYAKLDDTKIQELAQRVYSFAFLTTLARGRPDLQGLLETLKDELRDIVVDPGWLGSLELLPMDRRSILTFFLADMEPARRRDLIRVEIAALIKGKESPNGDKSFHSGPRSILDPIRALQHWLGIDRYITLNFDFQLEHSLILDDVRATQPPPSGFEAAVKVGELEPDGDVGAYSRRLSDGLRASTQIYSDKSVGRLYEFALNSADYRAQILHLHGRADVPDSMLLTDLDSNNQYRRDRNTRSTLEQALDVTLTGNPVLFVGIGLSEAEITRALRELVSRGHSTPNNPAFAIMPIDHGGSSWWRQQVASFKQYGIHLLGAGLPEVDEFQGLAKALEVLDQLLERTEQLGDEPTDADMELRAAARALMIIKGLWLDRELFPVLVERLCAATTVTVPPHTVDSWKDYLRRLKDKAYTLATVNCIRSLRDDNIQYRTRHEMVSPYDPQGQLLKDPVATPNALKVRDHGLWAPRPTVEHRHLAVLPPEAPPPSPAVLAAGVAVSCATSAVVTCFAPLSSGKGALLRTLAETYRKEDRPALVVNCNLGIEFESVIIRVQRFVWRTSNLSKPGAEAPVLERVETIANGLEAGAKAGLRPVIVLGGLERLVDSDGKPVAPELDLLLSVLLGRRLERSRYQVVLVGAEGCREFIDSVLRSDVDKSGEKPIVPTAVSLEPGSRDGTFVGHLLTTAKEECGSLEARKSLKRILELAEARSFEANVPNAARSQGGAAILRIVLERWPELAFKATEVGPIHRFRATLDLEILSELAFVGMPIEPDFLQHLPNIQELTATIKALEGGQPPAVEIEKSLERLQRFGIVLNVEPVQGTSQVRVVPHRSATAELRDRYGVRSGDEMLSNSFSLTLAISMPTDLVIAGWDLHRRLKLTVGRLRGAWKDTILPDPISEPLLRIRDRVDEATAGQFDPISLKTREQFMRLDRALRMATDPIDVSLRAAAGIMRGFFAAASLVAQMPTDQVREDGELGEFEEHKRRLGHLIERLRDNQSALEDAKTYLDALEQRLPTVSAQVSTIRAQLERSEQLPALYGGEVVWLLNERAVIALLQGDLYEAQRGFRDADRANRTFRTARAGQAWRRIEINRCLVRIERGRISEAKSKLEEIRRQMAGIKHRSLHEDELSEPLITGYLALCDHLEGSYQDATEKFEASISALAKTGQQRALAVTHIRRASMRYGLGLKTEADNDIRFGLAAAEAGRQIDVVWRARLTELGGTDRKGQIEQTETAYREARRYAHVMDLPRVAVQAVRGEAEFRLELGDLEAASILAAEAMKIATRYGMTLHRIALRALMGTILIKRGDRSGLYLLQRSLVHADRVGYQLQVERSHRLIQEANARRAY